MSPGPDPALALREGNIVWREGAAAKKIRSGKHTHRSIEQAGVHPQIRQSLVHFRSGPAVTIDRAARIIRCDTSPLYADGSPPHAEMAGLLDRPPAQQTPHWTTVGSAGTGSRRRDAAAPCVTNGAGQSTGWVLPRRDVVKSVLLAQATACITVPPALVLQTAEGAPSEPQTSVAG